MTVSAVTLPKVYIGDTWLGKISNKNPQAPLVDEVLKLVGTIGLFQVLNKGKLLWEEPMLWTDGI